MNEKAGINNFLNNWMFCKS